MAANQIDGSSFYHIFCKPEQFARRRRTREQVVRGLLEFNESTNLLLSFSRDFYERRRPRNEYGVEKRKCSLVQVIQRMMIICCSFAFAAFVVVVSSDWPLMQPVGSVHFARNRRNNTTGIFSVDCGQTLRLRLHRAMAMAIDR